MPGALVTSAGITATTGAAGDARIVLPSAGEFRVIAARAGFVSLERIVTVGAQDTVSLEFTLEPAAPQSVTVEAKIDDGQGVAPPVNQMRALPLQPRTLRDALPLIPGIVRTPEGKLRLSGTAEHRSSLLVNSIDVTDPATGRFGATVPIDSVETLVVYQSPFLAEYGRFTAGVVAVETRRGGEKWRYEFNDPTPELRLRSRRLVGIRGFTPRLGFNGTLRRERLYYSQSTEYALRKTPIFALPFPRNEEKRESWNSLSQLDWLASPRQTLTLTAHLVPQKANFVHLNLLNAQPTAPSWRAHEARASLGHRYSVAGGLLDSALAFSDVEARVGAQGEEPFVYRPPGNTGNWFARQQRRARRWQGAETWTPAAIGGHQPKLGVTLLRTQLSTAFDYRPVRFEDLFGGTLARLDFLNHPGASIHDTETSIFLQDHWTVLPQLSFDFGLRVDDQRITGRTRTAPRASLAWSPFGDGETTVRLGYGWFFDRVPLNVFAFHSWPERLEDDVRVLRSFPDAGLAPQSRAWRVQLERRLGRFARLRTAYLQQNSSDLIVLRRAAGELRLTGEGRGRYRQFEVTTRLSFQREQEFFLSYVNSVSRGHLNEFSAFLGDYSTPVVRPDLFAIQPGNVPHRFLAWGVAPLRYGWRLAPVIEYRNGFPYMAADARQNYAGMPNERRFPVFFSLDLRVSKDVQVRPGKVVRISMSWFNLTNHFNPDSVRSNVDDPAFGRYFGQRPRRYRLDLDFFF
ncbi:MAG: TonB-dependent receptor [Bryobacteraceae bacterium]|nr:TonB-dependent receptor [Bryobacteraceae bacterium]